jgi:hypothetical protein
MSNNVHSLGRPVCLKGHIYVPGSFTVDDRGRKKCLICTKHKLRRAKTTCVDCGELCRFPYRPDRPPRCRSCRVKFSAHELTTVFRVREDPRSEDDEKVIGSRIVLYGRRYIQGLDIWTGIPLPSEDLIENGRYVRVPEEQPCTEG